MIVYLDTSSLVKLYAEENRSEEVERLVSQANTVATSCLAYVEARSAFARKLRDGIIDAREYQRVVVEFEMDWGKYLVLAVSQAILMHAGELAYALRALDAIHLASALQIRWKPGPSPPFLVEAPLVFSSADGELLTAAQAEGLRIHDSR